MPIPGETITKESSTAPKINPITVGDNFHLSAKKMGMVGSKEATALQELMLITKKNLTYPCPTITAEDKSKIGIHFRTSKNPFVFSWGEASRLGSG
jgi:hypothetical protein